MVGVVDLVSGLWFCVCCLAFIWCWVGLVLVGVAGVGLDLWFGFVCLVGGICR